jgi:hypothetical protein
MLILPSLQQRKPFVIGQRNRRRSARVFCCELPDLIERDLEKCARAESIDTGKPISIALLGCDGGSTIGMADVDFLIRSIEPPESWKRT